METLTKDGKSFLSSMPYHFKINQEESQSQEKARSGKYSFKLEKEYGGSFSLNKVRSDQYYKISIWFYGKAPKGILVASSQNAKDFYKTAQTPVLIENDWNLLELGFYIPEKMDKQDLTLYFWNNSGGPVYLDDYKIERKVSEEYPEFDFEEPLKIYIDSLEMDKLRQVRKRALQKGVLESTDEDWVRAIVFAGNKMMKAKMRLKGDWLDHLDGVKWSFRIKLNKKYSWRGMRTFSIQTPSSRYFLSEWIAHKVFEKEGLLTTRYGFIPISLNDNNLGIYAYEEHFEKNLVESSKRREGPILKFEEEGMWEVNKTRLKTNMQISMPDYEAADILAFKENQILSNPVLFEEFKIAQNLMHQYKRFENSASDIFDIEKMAKYYALMDIMRSYHGIVWHNQRYYYNPVLSKLEPVVFDCYGEAGPYDEFKTSVLGLFNQKLANLNINMIYFYVFKDEHFRNYYQQYLKQYSAPEYFQEILSVFGDDILKYEKELKREFSEYSYDTVFLLNSAQRVHNALDSLQLKFENPEVYEKVFENNFFNTVFPDTNQQLIPPTYYVKAFTEGLTEDQKEIAVFNYFTEDIILLGTGKNLKRIASFFHPEPELSQHVFTQEVCSIKTATNAAYLFYMVKGKDETFACRINPWPSPQFTSPRQELEKNSSFSRSDFASLKKGREITFTAGNYTLNEPLIIPENLKVVFEPGVEMDMTNKSFIISYSPVYFNGSKTRQVIVQSSDKTGMGLIVIGAKSRSLVNYAVFDNLNCLNYKGWSLTGAVTFYESGVDFNYTSLQNNHCEDALNIIRSDFKVENCEFTNIFSDAFDSDFCTGSLLNSRFDQVLNDAIDFSGSQITIVNNVITNCGDKGVSGGENSQLIVRGVNISNCNIGIASKDLSVVEVSDSKVNDCNYGLVALTKKPEYGPANLTTVNLILNNNSTVHLIEEGSQLMLNGTLIAGDKKNIADLFYKK
jgi:hypothetical protein